MPGVVPDPDEVENEMEMPEVVRFTLEKMRRAVESDPHVLFEDWGGPYGGRADYVFADVYGFEDELLHEFIGIGSSVLPVCFTPIRQRISLVPPDDDDLNMTRTAEHGLRSGWAQAAIDASYLPEWNHDDQFLVNLLYVRYKRRR